MVADAVLAPNAAAEGTSGNASETIEHRFQAESAGTVSVLSGVEGLRLGTVTPSEGWTWNLTQAGANEMAISFTNGPRTLVLTALLGADASVTATLNEPQTEPQAETQVPPQTAASPPSNSGSRNGGATAGNDSASDESDHTDTHADEDDGGGDHGTSHDSHEGRDDDD
jgi:hypothetical protein